MKLKKFTSWSGNRVSKEKRQAGKAKSKRLPPEEKNANSGGSPSSINVPSGKCLNASPMHESISAAKEEVKLMRGDFLANPTTTQTKVLSNIEDDRPFLFEDNEDDNINDSNHGKSKNDIATDPNLKHRQIANLAIPAPITKTPKADHATPLVSSPKNLFHPPQEIMVDHLAVPPSPMREPNVNVIASPSMGKRLLDDCHPGVFLNFQEPSPRNHCLGDPVGDIAMQRQLMDAQRLVRIILGKPLNKSQEILGETSILQAIRSYALMKAELIDLRKKQEISDGDPPAILQTLGSPAATTPSTTRTGVFGTRTSGLQKDINDSDNECESIGHQSAQSNVNINSPIASALEQSNHTIRRLQAELSIANRTIVEIKEKMERGEGENNFQKSTKLTHQIELSEQHKQNDQHPDELVVEEPQVEENPEVKGGNEFDEDELCCHNNEKLVMENEGSRQLIQKDEHHDQTALEESKQDESLLDLLLDEIFLIPQRVLTKDVVREKLALYYTRIAQRSSESKMLAMKKKMRQSLEESDRRILEMEEKLKLQDQQHKNQLQEIFLSREHIRDVKTEQNQTTVLKELSHNTTANTSSDHLSSSMRKPMAENVTKSIAEEI